MRVSQADRSGWACRTGLAVALAVLVAGCSSVYRNHGYVPTDEDLAEIVVGVDTRDTVSETVGPPSSLGVLDESGYYYVASRMRHYGMRAPEEVERNLVAIRFDDAGVVRNIERYGIENGRVVTLDRRVTDSAVNDQTFLRQLLGNIGNFNPGSLLEDQ